MAKTSLAGFLLNSGNTDTAVSAPAYSITKVLVTGASVFTPLAALLISKINSVTFSSAEIVTLIVAVLGFLAVVTTADVVSRSLATAKTATDNNSVRAAPVERSPGILFEFDPVRKGRLLCDGPDPDVEILAGRGPELLIAEPGEQLRWVPQEQVTFCDSASRPRVT